MPAEHVDVLIVGAGLSGVGAACHLRDRCPDKTVAILEARGAIGGTWDLFRYPGIRSDSDMFTLGYSFRPWTEPQAIADGGSILDYIRATARERGVDRAVRFHHRVVGADWDGATARWTVRALRSDTGGSVELTCSFLYVCTGYYRYDAGYTPTFAGVDRFRGQVVHPQQWPADLDHRGKRVVVVGSGATAITIVPAMAADAAHVTMVQRSPSYVMSLATADPIGDWLRRRLPRRLALQLIRWKNVLLATLIFQLSRRAPTLMRSLLRTGARRQLPPGYPVDTHFAPRYAPWDQRLCFVPDGDLFRAIKAGRASVVTDGIDTFTEHGLRLASGAELAADIVVTATGLTVLALGGMKLTVDGREVDVADTVAYKGMMLSGVPNLALALGYTNASWTLKCDLTSAYVCRLLAHLDRHGYQVCTPVPPPAGPLRPLIDLKSGYVLRSLDRLPKQGAAAPWRLYQNYPRDLLMLRHGPVADEGVRFSRVPVPAAAGR
jgi:cation diffusion facilitator CzcD-associated flavoprotein CzcO